MDPDVVDATNLQRQVAHGLDWIGKPKAHSLKAAIGRINPDVLVTAIVEFAQGEPLLQRVMHADVVLDCTDRFSTRHAINRACRLAGRPLISGAAMGFDGQLSVYDPREDASPCYACVYPEHGLETPDANCATMGVWAPLVGTVGSLQASQALWLAGGQRSALVGQLQLHNAQTGEWTTIQTPRRQDCQVCGGAANPSGLLTPPGSARAGG
jgi:molybdopterin/thiamine biosynthesis adenylyltransferase